MSEVKPCIHGRNFCLECHAPNSEQGLKAALDSARGREAALREELETEKRANYNAKVALKAASETCELWKGRTTNMTHTNSALQQRLTVAEQRAGELEGLLHMSKELLTTISRHGVTTKPNDWCDSFKAEVADRIEKIGASLKPAEADPIQKLIDENPLAKNEAAQDLLNRPKRWSESGGEGDGS